MGYELASGGTVEVTNRNTGTPGLVQFTGAVTSTGGTGVNLDNNDNGTVTFSGGLVLSTGANAAYTATNGGTVSVTGATNTLTTTTGTAPEPRQHGHRRQRTHLPQHLDQRRRKGHRPQQHRHKREPYSDRERWHLHRSRHVRLLGWDYRERNRC